MQIFNCGRGDDRKYCKCGRAAVGSCAFPLRGKKAGQTCGVFLCERCTRENNRCLAHHDFEKRKGA